MMNFFALVTLDVLNGPFLNPDHLGLNFACDPGFGVVGEHVDFAADAELGEVDAGLYGEAGVGQDAALVVGFEVVEVGAVAVEFGGDVVASAVREEVCEARVADDRAGGVVGFVACDGVIRAEGLLDAGDGGVAGVADGGKDVLFALGGGAADDGCPSDVIPNGCGVVSELGPDVN